jgi:hypothetical protein
MGYVRASSAEVLGNGGPGPVLVFDGFETLGSGSPVRELVFDGLKPLQFGRKAYTSKIFQRRFFAKSRVRTALIIIAPPGFNELAGLDDRGSGTVNYAQDSLITFKR